MILSLFLAVNLELVKLITQYFNNLIICFINKIYLNLRK